MTKILIQQQLDSSYRVWCDDGSWELALAMPPQFFLHAEGEACAYRDRRFEQSGNKDYLAIEELESLYVKDNLIKAGKYGGV